MLFKVAWIIIHYNNYYRCGKSTQNQVKGEKYKPLNLLKVWMQNNKKEKDLCFTAQSHFSFLWCASITKKSLAKAS